MEESLKLPVRDMHGKRGELYVKSISKNTKWILCPDVITQIRHLATHKAAGLKKKVI